MTDDQDDDAPTQDGTVESAAAAIAELMKNKPQEEEEGEAPPSLANTPASVPGGSGLGNVEPIPSPTLTSRNTGALPANVSAPLQFQRGNALSPQTYAFLGEVNGLTPVDPALLWEFKKGSPMDAQAWGANPNYGNYAFGAYNAAADHPLGLTLWLADQYGKYASSYKTTGAQKVTLDSEYTHIPSNNVESIKQGYQDYQRGTLRNFPGR